MNLLRPRIQAPRSGSELRDQQRATEHGNVLHEHDHLDVCHHGVLHGPEVVHGKTHGNEEQHQQPGANSSSLTKQNAQSAGKFEDA